MSSIVPGEVVNANVRTQPEPLSSVSFLLGTVVFVVSFALPAIKFSHGVMAGYLSAYEVMTCTLSSSETTALGRCETGLISLINPAVILFLVAAVAGRWRQLRAWIPPLIVFVLLPVCWTFIFSMEGTASMGHILWVMGMLLIFAGEISSWRMRVQLAP